MIYNTEVHLPQMVEFFINDYREGDVEKLEANKIMLLKILKDTSLHNEILQIEKKRKEKSKELWDVALKDIRNVVEIKKEMDIFIGIEGIKKRLSEELIRLEQDNWETVFSKIINFIKVTKGYAEE